MECLLLVSLQILYVANGHTLDTKRLGERLLKLNAKREALLSILSGAEPQTVADKARWELVRYVNKVAQKKIAEKI